MLTSHARRRENAWRVLAEHAATLGETSLASLFADDARRADDFVAEACGLYLDYSKQRLDTRGRAMLLELAEACDVAGWRARMFAGDHVNSTEDRAALHVALRWPAGGALPGADGASVVAEVEAVRQRMATFSDSVRAGDWTGFRGEPMHHVVNIGIGGSDLGPAMVCKALDTLGHERLDCHFVSNLDSNHLASVLERCEAARTLFVVSSKSFSTQETLTNAASARRWLVAAAGGDEAAVARHFVAVSTALDRCAEFGIPSGNVFGFWDWVGGRFSLWSAIGLSMAVYLGMDVLRAMHRGAHAMDRHFLDAPMAQNLPVLLALVGIWNRNLMGHPTHAILPYDHALELFPAYLQQLEMESNGKGVDRDGNSLERPAAPVIWGTLGNNGQHAFYQLMHQGLESVPADLLLPAFSQRELAGHESGVIANALAQAEALMRGRDIEEARDQLAGSGLAGEALDRAAAHRCMRGNRPTTTILYERLGPEVLGALVALYEHKVFVQAVCWNINPFDQFGVELGKQLASALEPLVRGEGDARAHDPSTRNLLARIRRMRQDA